MKVILSLLRTTSKKKKKKNLFPKAVTHAVYAVFSRWLISDFLTDYMMWHLGKNHNNDLLKK